MPTAARSSNPQLNRRPPGAVLGLAILAFSCTWSGISTQVGAAVAIALPVSQMTI
jgi:hypothetical protein